MNPTLKVQALLRSGRTLLDVRTLGALMGVKPASARVLGTRLVQQGLLDRLRRDLYLPVGVTVLPFEIANALVQPSYVSFESALNRWGVIVQVPMQVVSAAARPRRITVRGTEFLYRRLPKPVLDVGWIKDGQAYVAIAEKALLDALYLRAKGLLSLDLADVDDKKIDRKRLIDLLKVYPPRFQSWCTKVFQSEWRGYAGVR